MYDWSRENGWSDYWFPHDLVALKLNEEERRKRRIRKNEEVTRTRTERPKPFNFSDVLKKEDPTLFIFPIAPTNRT